MDPIRPYRTFETKGYDEYPYITRFLEQLGLTCLDREAGLIDGFEGVYIIPVDKFYLIYPEENPQYAAKFESLRVRLEQELSESYFTYID